MADSEIKEISSATSEPMPAGAMPMESSPKVEPMASSAATAKKKSNVVLYVIIGLIVLCLCCSVLIGGLWFLGNNAARQLQAQVDATPTNSNANDADSTPSNEGVPVDAVDNGETKSAADFTFTLNSVRKDGDHYILNLTVMNDTSRALQFSTLLYADMEGNTGTDYDQNLFYSGKTAASLDQMISANGKVTGEIVFKVEDNPTELDLVMTGSLLSDEEARFAIL